MEHKVLKKMIIKLIVLVTMAYFISQFESCISNQDEEIYRNHPVVTSNYIPQYYNDLFKPEIRQKLKLIVSYEKKAKDTVVNFLYDGKYFIQMYKISGMFNFSLKNSLMESYVNAEQEVGVIYYDNQRSRISIHDKMVISKDDTPAKIFISLFGNNAKIVAKNDSLVDYYLECKNLSIKYHLNGPQEVFAEAYKSADAVPLEVLFFRKNRKLYLLFISPTKGKELSGSVSKLLLKT